MSNRYVVLSGCSGGGKSTLLAELQRRGHSVVREPGRRVVRAEFQSGGGALPWVDIAAFARRAIETSIADRDTASAFPALERLGRLHRYNETVFLTPPWPEIYVGDPERRHGLEDAIAEYERLERAYPMLGYRVIVLPKVAVETRADVVLTALNATR
jgi:predicted ATPase